MTVSLDNGAAGAAGRMEKPKAGTFPAIQAWITPEVLLYVALGVLSLALRTVQLGHMPLSDAEAHQALAALRMANDRVPGDALIADSPLTFILNALTFGFGLNGDVIARLPVALAGVLLTLSPALWRRYLNPLPPLIVSLLLTISPAALLASRTMSPVIWTMLLAVVAPWLVLRFVETRQPRWGVAATAAFAAMVFLTEPGGLLVLVSLAFGVGFAWLTDDGSESQTDITAAIRSVWREWPWVNGALAAGLLVIVVGTGLFWIPSGLTMVGNVIWACAEGFAKRSDGAPVAFPLWVSLRYEFGFLLFGLIASYRAVREGGFFERALVGWALAGLFWSVGYAGADAAHALWMTVPFSVLIGLMVTGWISERAGAFWDVPAWGVLLHAVITLGLWLAVGLSAILLGKRLLYDLPGGVTELGKLIDVLLKGVYSRNTDQPEWITVQDTAVLDYVLGYIQLRILLTLLMTLLNAVLFFLAGSLWGARAAWRGFALGTLGWLLLFSFGLGGRAALGAPGDPREYWFRQPVTDDIFELRATLEDMSLRDTGEPRLMEITALVPGDSALAWALRDYPHTVFVDGVGPEITSAAVVMPGMFPQPRMGADYVGKDLITRLGWDVNTLSWRDGLMWFYRGDSLVKPMPQEQTMLWIRKDVYGVEFVTED
jgi:hypothetical protein